MPVTDDNAARAPGTPARSTRGLEQRAHAIDGLAAGLAHEINNVLQVVLGYVGFARDALAPGSQPHADLTEALGAAGRAATVTRGLLDFARGRGDDPGEVDINHAIDSLVAQLAPMFSEAIELTVAPSPVPLVAPVAGIELRQALLNLCLNSCDAMPETGRLHITAQPYEAPDGDLSDASGMRPGLYGRIIVSDTGCGLRPEWLRRAFEPLFSTKDCALGAGMGLATVRAFASHSGGVATLYSDGDSTGAAASLFLPIRRPAVPVAPPPTADPRHPATILYAEDDPAVRRVGERMLADAGYRVVAVSDGEEALTRLAEHGGRVDLLLVDAVMPRMGGRAVLEGLRRMRVSRPVAFCTGYDPRCTRVGLLAEDPDRVITKPFDADHLLRFVDRQLNRCRATAPPSGADGGPA